MAAIFCHLFRVSLEPSYSSSGPQILHVLHLLLVRIQCRNPELFTHAVQDLLWLLQDLLEIEKSLTLDQNGSPAASAAMSPPEEHNLRKDLPPGSVLIQAFTQFFQHLNCTQTSTDPDLGVSHSFPCCNGTWNIVTESSWMVSHPLVCSVCVRL